MSEVVYHVAGENWDWGRPLLCWDELSRRGMVSAANWHWETYVGFDGDMVCVYEELDDARGHQETYGGQVLEIRPARPSEADETFYGYGRDPYSGQLVRIHRTRSAEGFAGFTPMIPAAWIRDRCTLAREG